jgi:hypothetical protein
MSEIPTRAAMAAAILLAAAGCDWRKPGQAVAANEAAAAPAFALAEGQWEISTQQPAPPGRPMPPPNVATTHINAEQAIDPRRFFAPDAGESCRENNIRVANRRISGRAICPGQGGFREVGVEVNGSYGQRQFNLTTDTYLGGMKIREERRGRFLRR